MTMNANVIQSVKVKEFAIVKSRTLDNIKPNAHIARSFFMLSPLAYNHIWDKTYRDVQRHIRSCDIVVLQ